MKLDIVEGFDQYARLDTAEGGLGAVYPSTNMDDAGARVAGLNGRGYAWSVRNSFSSPILYLPCSLDSKLSAAFAFKWRSAACGNTTSRFFAFTDANFGIQFGFRKNDAHKLVLVNNASNTLAVGEISILEGIVYRINMTADLVTGNLMVRINGEKDIGLSQNGLALKSQVLPQFGAMRLLTMGGGTTIDETHAVDDIVIATGGLEDWGPLEVFTGVPSADLVKQWNRSAGADNFANVDDATFDGAVTFNSSVTPGQKDILDFGDLPASPETIVGLAVSTMAKKDESANREFRNILRIGGIDHNGPNLNCGQTYYNHRAMFKVNPLTNQPFTAAELATLGVGYELMV